MKHEKSCQKNGLSLKGRPFFDGLRAYLAGHGAARS